MRLERREAPDGQTLSHRKMTSLKYIDMAPEKRGAIDLRRFDDTSNFAAADGERRLDLFPIFLRLM